MTIKFVKSTPEYRKWDDAAKRREPYDVVLGRPTSASPRGSTYWKRVKRCPRELALYEGGLRKTNPFSDAIVVGLFYHLGLEHYYRSLQSGATGDASEQAAWRSLTPFASAPGYEECYEIIERMLGAYFERWRETDTRDWEILAVEETVEHITEEMPWTGRFDLLIRRRSTGMGWLVEHKSTGRITEDLLQGYQMDLQIPGYSWLARKVVDFDKLNTPYVGCIVNLATREKNPRLERLEVVPSKAHMAEFEMSVRAWEQMRKTFGALGHPKSYGHCIGAPRYFSRCDYFDICYSHPESSVEQILSEEAPHGFVNTNLTGPVSSIDPDEAS